MHGIKIALFIVIMMMQSFIITHSLPLFANESVQVSIPPQQALDAYFNADVGFFDQDFAPGSVGEALAMKVNNHERAASALEKAALVQDASIKTALAELAVQTHVIAYRYREAARVNTRFGLSVLNDVQKVYASFPPATAQATQNIIEIPYRDGKIAGLLNGQKVTIIFDTGAQNIGVVQEVVAQLNLRVDKSASRVSRVPAYGLAFPVYGVLIDELKIGGLTLTNLPANTGVVPEEQQAAAERLRAMTNHAELILGLDPFRNFVDVIEFDWDKQVVRFIIHDHSRSATANYVLNDGGAPVFQVQAGERTTNLAFDSGAYGHLIGAQSVEAAQKVGKRTYRAHWGEFSEYLCRLHIADLDGIAFWASQRSHGEDEKFNVTGVLGVLGSGQLRLDLQDARIDIHNYQPKTAKYDFDIIEESFNE